MNTTLQLKQELQLQTDANEESERTPLISKVFGDGDDAYRLAWISGWLLKVPLHRFDIEPRVCDSHLADCLGLDSPNLLREMILCFLAEEIPTGDHTEMALLRWGAELDSTGDVQFWLTEHQALDVLYRSETTVDSALLSELFEAFAEARVLRVKGLLDRNVVRAKKATIGMVQVQRMLSKSVNRKVVKRMRSRQRELLENPATLAQLYEILESRLERESWYPVLKPAD